MKALYVPFSAEALEELAGIAATNLRTPRQQAAYFLVEALNTTNRPKVARGSQTISRRQAVQS